MRVRPVSIHFDEDRAEIVLGTLYRKYLARQFPFNTPEAQVPQIPENLPKNGFASPRDHACFLFLSCLWMRGKIKSDTAIRGLSRIYETVPEAFDPKQARNFDPEVIVQHLKENSLGFASYDCARFWIENMARLDDHWGGDPRNIFADVSDYGELCRRVCNAKTKRQRVSNGYPGFLGFQKKMASMLAYFLMHASLVKLFTFPLPVDFHVMRIFIAHRILLFKGKVENFSRQHILDAAREFAIQFATKHKVDSLHFSEFIWCFSRAMCDKHPGNVSTYIGERTRRGVILAKPITWHKGQEDTYNVTCGQCPVEPTCTACIPAALYYNLGKLVIRSRRDKPPQGRLFPPTHIVLRKKREWRKEDHPEPATELVQQPQDKQLSLLT